MNAKKIGAAVAIATAIAIPAEGLRRTAYSDPTDVRTVCFGTTRNVIENKVYSIEECKALLTDDMRAAVEAVERCHPGLPVNVLAAFGDAAYNLGPKIACDRRNSTAARLLDAGDIEGACRQLPRWDRGRIAGVLIPLPGLAKRRKAEMELCLQG